MCENLDYRCDSSTLLELKVKGGIVLKDAPLTGVVIEDVISKLSSMATALGLAVDHEDTSLEEFVLRVKET